MVEIAQWVTSLLSSQSAFTQPISRSVRVRCPVLLPAGGTQTHCHVIWEGPLLVLFFSSQRSWNTLKSWRRGNNTRMFDHNRREINSSTRHKLFCSFFIEKLIFFFSFQPPKKSFLLKRTCMKIQLVFIFSSLTATTKHTHTFHWCTYGFLFTHTQTRVVVPKKNTNNDTRLTFDLWGYYNNEYLNLACCYWCTNPFYFWKVRSLNCITVIVRTHFSLRAKTDDVAL